MRQCIQSGLPYPQKIRDAPELKPYEVYFFNAYQDLSTCRYHEGGFIPWIAAKEYALGFGGTMDDAEFLSRVCHELDELIFADMQAKKKPDRENAKPAGKGRRMLRTGNGEKD